MTTTEECVIHYAFTPEDEQHWVSLDGKSYLPVTGKPMPSSLDYLRTKQMFEEELHLRFDRRWFWIGNTVDKNGNPVRYRNEAQYEILRVSDNKPKP
jgi:hypothetical protein